MLRTPTKIRESSVSREEGDVWLWEKVGARGKRGERAY